MHYVIGDIHGYFDELMTLLQKIEERDSESRFIITGDLIDRGPKVMETLDWAMTHIKDGGKYQCVLGNHEDMVISWYYVSYLPWIDEQFLRPDPNAMPATRYDFAERLAEHGLVTRSQVSTYIDFFEKLPLYLTLTVETANGSRQEYAIAHAWYRRHWAGSQYLTQSQKKRNFTWEREAAGAGCKDEGLIVVHGHTPTVERACETKYYLNIDEEPINAGLIAYRHNAINLDGGRPYKDAEARFCTLSAICLETLEEFFADEIPSDYPYYENKYQKEMRERLLF